jgi:hypothetical protein
MAIEIYQISTQTLNPTSEYNSQVSSLIPSSNINELFTSSSYIEFFIYDLNNSIISTEYNFFEYTILNDGQLLEKEGVSKISIDLEKVFTNRAFSTGEYNSSFNFFNKKIGSPLEKLYITEIS